MIFGKPEQKGKPAEAGTPMPSAATLPPTAAAPAAAAAAAPTPVPSSPVPLAVPTPGSAPAAGGSSPAPRERQTATIRYVDRPDVGETFADSITGLVFDGQTLRIEFSVTRVDEVKPDAPMSLSGEPHRAVAESGDRAHQPHAADRSGPYPGWRGQDGAGARPEAAIKLKSRYGYRLPPARA
jgi:hypothetical protein